MKTNVYYVSPKGSAEQVAEVIAREARCVKEPLMPAYMPENRTLLFLGCEGSRPDRVTMDFIAALSRDRAAHCALFVCAKDDSALHVMRRALAERGVDVLEQTFVAPLRGLLGGGPKPEDLERARSFARDCEKAVI